MAMSAVEVVLSENPIYVTMESMVQTQQGDRHIYSLDRMRKQNNEVFMGRAIRQLAERLVQCFGVCNCHASWSCLQDTLLWYV